MPKLRSVVPGFVLGFASIALGIVQMAFGSHPQVAAAALLQLAIIVAGIVYYFMVIHRIHRVLAAATNAKYPVSGARAVGFSFIPVFNLYWKFKWTGEIACFLNHVSGQQRYGKNGWGAALLLAGFLSRIVPGFSLLIGFLVLQRISKAVLDVLPSAKLPVEDYTERYKSAAALILILILLFIIFIGLLAAIAIPNFVAAKNRALENQRAAQSRNASATAP